VLFLRRVLLLKSARYDVQRSAGRCYGDTLVEPPDNIQNTLITLGPKVVALALECQHSEREVTLNLQKCLDTIEPLRSNANDRYRMPIDKKTFADDMQVRIEVLLPIGVAEN